MNRLLGTPPNQITEEEKEAKLKALWEESCNLPHPPKDDEENTRKFLEQVSEIRRQANEIERNYPDLPPETPIRVVKVEHFGGACPTQLEGKTEDGKEVYARYRGGRLSVRINDESYFAKQLDWGEDDDHSYEYYLKFWGDEERAKSAVQSHEMLKSMNGGYVSYRGSISYEGIIEATKGWLIWPNEKWENWADPIGDE